MYSTNMIYVSCKGEAFLEHYNFVAIFIPEDLWMPKVYLDTRYWVLCIWVNQCNRQFLIQNVIRGDCLFFLPNIRYILDLVNYIWISVDRVVPQQIAVLIRANDWMIIQSRILIVTDRNFIVISVYRRFWNIDILIFKKDKDFKK